MYTSSGALKYFWFPALCADILDRKIKLANCVSLL